MTENLTFLLMVVYFERPIMVRNVLESISRLTYPNWELAFIDDGSIQKGEPIVKEILGEYSDKIKLYYNEETVEHKLANEGSMVGSFMNRAMEESAADVVIILCDDDAIVENSLEYLNEFYKKYEEIMYAYSHVIEFNPFTEKPVQPLAPRHSWFNRTTKRHYPACQFDCSQMTFRRKCYTDGMVRCPFPQTTSIDAKLWEQLHKAYGDAYFTGGFTQYKGVYGKQMGRRKDAYDVQDLEEDYHGMERRD